jgi:hypothetical protein
VAGTIELGYPESVIGPLGRVQVVWLVAYLVPRTSVLGAILWTGYQGERWLRTSASETRL